MIPQLVNKFPAFMVLECPLSFSQQSATYPYPETNQLSPSFGIKFFKHPLYYYPCIYA
jgi:hypothetical protein